MIRAHRFIYISLLLISACSINKPTNKPVNMTYQQCLTSDKCNLSGLVKIEEVNHTFMGKLILDDGECVHLSLSDTLINDIRHSGEMHLSVFGARLPKPVGMDNMDFLEVNGRKVGWDICSQYYLFVF